MLILGAERYRLPLPIEGVEIVAKADGVHVTIGGFAFQPMAGGVWDNPLNGHKQAHIDFQDDADGWVRYSIRQRAKIRHIVGDKQTHATGP